MKKILSMLLFTGLMISLCGCQNASPVLEGSYQSEMVNGYCVQISIERDQKKFFQYIDNRPVQEGTYEALENGAYRFVGSRNEFEIVLSPKNTFEISIPKIKEEGPILLEQVEKVPATFGTEFDDVEKYQALLEDNL